MKEYLEKYASILLEDCLKIKKGEPLYIAGPMERYDFIRILVKKAYEIGVKDIKLNLKDAYIKHEQIQNLTLEELKDNDWWNASDYDEYAKKGSAFLSLACEYPGLMADVSAQKLAKMSLHMNEQTKLFELRRNKNELSWCIAAVPTQDWADKLFPNEKNSVDKLWKLILDICLITDKNPQKALNDKIKISHERAHKINKLNLKYLHYKNSLGTDLTVELPDNYLFHNIEMKLADGRIVFPNLPSEEIYSSPKKEGTNGIVYASKPLSHNGKLIKDFYLEFKDGKVIDFKAKEGYEELKEIINFDDSSCYLGEVALVDVDSPISNTNMLFYTTLFDENASCHLALGQSFADSIKGGEKLDIETLKAKGLNQSKTHVDFMIGTEDLEIIGIDKDNNKIEIFKNGNCIL